MGGNERIESVKMEITGVEKRASESALRRWWERERELFFLAGSGAERKACERSHFCGREKERDIGHGRRTVSVFYRCGGPLFTNDGPHKIK